MKKLIIAFILFFIPGVCVAADHVNIPREELKTLYRESIETKLLAEQDAEPFVYSIELASYKISLTPGGGKVFNKALVLSACTGGYPITFCENGNSKCLKKYPNA